MPEKKVVLITGATGGIGRAVAVYLDSVGYRVVLVARRQETLREMATGLSQDAVCIPYDLQDLEHIQTIFDACRNQGILLYGLVHCAGMNRDQAVRANDLTNMVQVMNLNLLAFVQLAKYFCQKKYSEEGGALVGLSSVATLTCAKGMCTYSASKAGVDAAVRVMSKEFARRRIRANSIQPSFVDTEMARNTINYEAKIAEQPLGVIDPLHVAYLVDFLLSEKAKFISGSNVKISAGVI